MTEEAYSNGLPHPPQSLRRRIVIELAIIGVLTLAFFLFSHSHPETHNNVMYVGLALLGLGMIELTRRETNELIWGPPGSPPFDRARRCAVNISLLTIPPVIIFFIIGAVDRHYSLHWLDKTGTMIPMLSVHFFMALCLYLPWALLQQTLFQFYLLGRLRALLPFASPLLLSVINGIAYGLVHIEKPEVMVVTIIGGIFWSYSYHRDRYVLPIAISHALLGTTFYYWIYNHDLIAGLAQALPNSP